MKRLSELMAEDLKREPVWEYHAVDGDDDALVSPSSKRELTEADEVVHIARTTFWLADGSGHVGFCSPQDDSGLDYVQPVITAVRGQVSLWFDRPADVNTLRLISERLSAVLGKIFPIHYECDVLVDGRRIHGLVPFPVVVPSAV